MFNSYVKLPESIPFYPHYGRLYVHMGFSENGEIPKLAGWFRIETSQSNSWMMTGGTPMT